MYCSNQSSMATLLQQKSFMKNLSNGANNVVVVNGTGGSEENPDGTTSLVTAGTVTGGTSRMLLPHESLTAGGLIHQQPLIHQQTGGVTSASFNSQFISHLQSTHNLSTQQLFGTAVATTTSFQQQSPQFNNAYVDVNAIFRSTATSSSTNSSNSSSSFASPHHQLPHLVATSNATSSLVYVNGTHQNSASISTSAGLVVPKSEPNHHLHSQHLHHHQQQQQQTATESQTANNNHNATTDPNRGSSTSGHGGRGNGTEEQKPATATNAAAAAAPSPTDASLTKDGAVKTEHSDGVKTEQHPDDQEQEAEPEIDIVINNVVCSFSVRCHLNLRDIAQKGFNVEFRRENGMVTMKLRRPYTTASIWSSGKITCTGATSEDQAKVAARRYSRCLQKLGFNVRFRNFRIVNVLGTCSMPWGIMIVNFSEKYKGDASYEPELHPGVTYKLHSPKATLKIFSTGSITVTAASVAFVQAAIEHIFPLVYEFRKKRTPQEKLDMLKQPAFDPADLIEEVDPECDNVDSSAAGAGVVKMAYEDDDDEDPLVGGGGGGGAGGLDDGDQSTKAIQHQRRNARRLCKSRYSSSHASNGGRRRRPAGKADNDPTEDAMYVSDDDDEDDEDDVDEDMIDSD